MQGHPRPSKAYFITCVLLCFSLVSFYLFDLLFSYICSITSVLVTQEMWVILNWLSICMLHIVTFSLRFSFCFYLVDTLSIYIFPCLFTYAFLLRGRLFLNICLPFYKLLVIRIWVTLWLVFLMTRTVPVTHTFRWLTLRLIFQLWLLVIHIMTRVVSIKE